MADGIDQFAEPSIQFKIFDDSLEQYLPAGDTNIIYEYEGHPIGSVRLEMMRAGVEDYELLYSLNNKLRKKLIEKCLTPEFTAKVDSEEFDEIYKSLLGCIEENQKHSKYRI